MVDTAPLKAANAKRWSAAKVTRDVTAIAKRLVAAKSRYQAVSAKTGVPWPVIAVIHERESSQGWAGSLAQGDPWNRVSVHVPAGRGPFRSWEEAAIDALVNCAPHASRNKDWSISGALTKLEEYNGLGYAARGKPSPYIWAGTNQYRSGKYVRDGVYDPDVVDSQPGCAGLLLAMMALDPSISFTGSAITPSPVRADTKPVPQVPSVANPAKGSVGAFIASIFSAIFKRKP
jgi:lysozyme family protein